MIYKIKNVLICVTLFFTITLLAMVNLAVYKSLKETYFDNRINKPVEITIKEVEVQNDSK